MKSLNILIIMDPIKSINFKKDTTLAMMWASEAQGHTLGYAQVADLWLNRGELQIDAQSLSVVP